MRFGLDYVCCKDLYGKDLVFFWMWFLFKVEVVIGVVIGLWFYFWGLIGYVGDKVCCWWVIDNGGLLVVYYCECIVFFFILVYRYLVRWCDLENEKGEGSLLKLRERNFYVLLFLYRDFWFEFCNMLSVKFDIMFFVVFLL